MPVDVRGDSVDMDEITLLVAVPKAWFVLDWVVPNGKNHVSRVQEFVRRPRMEQTDAAAETIKELSRHDAGSLICARYPNVRFGKELSHRLRGAFLASEQPEQQDGLLGVADQTGSRADRTRVCRSEDSGRGRSQDVTLGRPRHDVFGSAHEGCSWPSRLSRAEGVRDHF